MQIFKILFVSILFIFAGCAATGPKFVQPDFNKEHSSQVFIYRPFMWLGSATAPDIYVNNEKIVRLWTGGYTYITVTSEKEIKISSGKNITRLTNTDEIVLNIKKGQKYFVRYVPHLRELLALDYIINSNNFELINESTAIEDIKECSYLEPLKRNY